MTTEVPSAIGSSWIGAVYASRVRRRLSWSVLLMLTFLGTGCGERVEVYPDRPILLICPWGAGGGTDRVARQLAVGLEEEFGVPVNVVNATGASGVTGHTRGALARPDGYTVTLMTAELNMLHWRGLTPVTFQDYRPVALVNRDPAALFVRKDAPWETLEELNQHVRTNPGELLASGTALGGVWHIALAGWLTEIGAEAEAVRWISIEGATSSLQELMAGGLDLVSCSLPEARSLLEAGEIRALGVMSEKRLGQFPSVPTLKEQGVDAQFGTWRGIGLPADTPDDVAGAMAAALEKVATGEEFRKFMRQAGFNWEFAGPEEFDRSLAEMDGSFGELLESDAFRDMGKDMVGAAAFPMVVGSIFLFTFMVLLLNKGLTKTEACDAFSWRGAGRVGEVLGSVLAYFFLAELLGFIVTSFLIVSFLMWRLKVRLPTALLVSAVLVLVVYQIFAIYLRVPFPRGIFGW